MRGDAAQGKFTIWYLSDGLLVAALTAGRSDDLDIATSSSAAATEAGPGCSRAVADLDALNARFVSVA